MVQSVLQPRQVDVLLSEFNVLVPDWSCGVTTPILPGLELPLAKIFA